MAPHHLGPFLFTVRYHPTLPDSLDNELNQHKTLTGEKLYIFNYIHMQSPINRDGRCVRPLEGSTAQRSFTKQQGYGVRGRVSCLIKVVLGCR
jgi:hypothetical protein